MRKFVIVVDAQNDFMRDDGKLYVPGSQEIIDNINNYLSDLNEFEVEGVLFTFDTHTEEQYAGSPESELFPPHCVHQTFGWELAINPDLLHPNIPAYRLHKSVFNMWEEEDINVVSWDRECAWHRDVFFKYETKKCTDFEVVGVATNFCVLWAVDGLLKYKPVNVLKDCVRGIVNDDNPDGNNPQLIFKKYIDEGKVKIL